MAGGMTIGDDFSGSPEPQPCRGRRKKTSHGLLKRIAVPVGVVLGVCAIGVPVCLATFGHSAAGLPPIPRSGASAPGAPSDAAALAALTNPAIVDVMVTFGSGSSAAAATGMVVTEWGLVLTNDHVVQGATRIEAFDVGNRHRYEATIVGTDAVHDVALIQLEHASGLPTIRVGSSARVRVGEGVVAVGNAEGKGGPPTYVSGEVVALDQTISVLDPLTCGVQTCSGLIETNAPVASGDSGGALVDPSGRVVAMISAGNGGFEPDSARVRGWAIPITQALDIAGKIDRGHLYLG